MLKSLDTVNSPAQGSFGISFIDTLASEVVFLNMSSRN